MDKIIGIEGWVLDKRTTDKERLVEASIYLKYPDLNSLIHLKPAERKIRIDQDLKEKFQRFKEIELTGEFILLGTKRRPRGIKTKVSLETLKEVALLDFIEHIFIEKVNGAKKKRFRPSQSFFCIKMTVAIEIEGQENGMQSIEERYVLVKAKTTDDAYEKLEKQKDNYVKPYLNPNGQLVRWRIESYDDCYETGITALKEFNNPEGVEVYSKLKSRKLTLEKVWNGK